MRLSFRLDPAAPASQSGVPTGVHGTGPDNAKSRKGKTTNDIFAFLTTDPNAEVGRIHPQAMPAILTTTEEVDTWMTAPADEAWTPQRPLPDGSLQIVASGATEDGIAA